LYVITRGAFPSQKYGVDVFLYIFGKLLLLIFITAPFNFLFYCYVIQIPRYFQKCKFYFIFLLMLEVKTLIILIFKQFLF
jgi:hypothetical protein